MGPQHLCMQECLLQVQKEHHEHALALILMITGDKLCHVCFAMREVRSQAQSICCKYTKTS